jgi:hypothetical protein
MTREARRAAHLALEAWEQRNPTKCTRIFDGICRCRDERRRFDLRPARSTATYRWQKEV